MAFELEPILRVGVAILALGVFVIAALSYRRRPTLRTLLLTIAFGIYFLKGIFLSSDILLPEQGDFLNSLGVLADAVFLILVTLAMFKS